MQDQISGVENVGQENEGSDCKRWKMKDQAHSKLSLFSLLVFLFNVTYIH